MRQSERDGKQKHKQTNESKKELKKQKINMKEFNEKGNKMET